MSLIELSSVIINAENFNYGNFASIIKFRPDDSTY